MQFSPELLAIIDDIGTAPSGLTVNRIFDDPEIGQVKVRAYSNDAEALRFEASIVELSETINLPRLWGRRNRCLVFQYLSLDQGDAARPESELYFGIGKILGLLNQLKTGSESPNKLDTEFSGWMLRFQKMDLLPERIAAKALKTYHHERPKNAVTCWDYWDAMPHNFGWFDHQLYILDEKHLRPSFSGVGLIKPYFLLDAEQWAQVRQGYESVASLQFFEEWRGFLEFYYLTAAMFFYSLAIEAGRIVPVENQRYLDYRDEFIRRATAYRLVDQAVGEIQLFAAYPKATPKIIVRRVKKILGVNHAG